MTLLAAPAARGRLAHHLVNLRQPDLVASVQRRLQKDGLVVVDGLTTPRAVASFADRFMRRSRVDEPHGLHEIRPTGRHHLRADSVDLTRAPMRLHTAGARLKHPPRLLLVVCARPADTGGDTLLVDGQDLLSELARRRPGDLGPLTRRTTMRTAPRIYAPVFRLSPAGRCVLRLPSGRGVSWSPAARRRLLNLEVAVERTRRRLSLAPGQGYLLDNWRWAHGRLTFAGERLLYRAEGDPTFRMPAGFPTWVEAT
ncbi:MULTISPECIES: TauD/TfdA family dioxygenase [Streptomyces]|uniref:TauD/TfdA-like domain-containing protein n=1 Tax=Streptomyces luteosporeus TaxID=173856 RepID=A0ABP6GAH7_9ACTN